MQHVTERFDKVPLRLLHYYSNAVILLPSEDAIARVIIGRHDVAQIRRSQYGVAPMTTIHRWTGREATLLREALRLSVRDFAARLGIGLRTVNKREARQVDITPLPHMQEVLDPALARTSDEAKARFSAAARVDVPEHETAQRSEPPGRGAMLPVMVDSRLVFVPINADTVASSGLSDCFLAAVAAHDTTTSPGIRSGSVVAGHPARTLDDLRSAVLDTPLPVPMGVGAPVTRSTVGVAAAGQDDDASAVLHLLETERVAEKAVSRNASARTLVSILLARECRSVTLGLRGLASRAGLLL